MTNYTALTQDVHTGCLLAYLTTPQAFDRKLLAARFGADTLHDGYERDKGYRDVMTFVPEGANPEDGVVRLYDRWGQWRIGGDRPDLVEGFAQWLGAQLGMQLTITW
jgi:hypothetical protein